MDKMEIDRLKKELMTVAEASRRKDAEIAILKAQLLSTKVSTVL